MRSHNLRNESSSESEIDTSSQNNSILTEHTNMTEAEGDGHEYFPQIDPEKIYEIGKYIFKMTPQAFYDKFYKDNAEISLDKFYIESMGHTNVNVNYWSELESDLGVFVREINFVIKLKDVPFVPTSRMIKAQKFIKEGDKISIVSSTTSLDVPYSSYFVVEDRWEIVPFEVDKSIVRLYSLK
jgi:hypothetical protein